MGYTATLFSYLGSPHPFGDPSRINILSQAVLQMQHCIASNLQRDHVANILKSQESTRRPSEFELFVQGHPYLVDRDLSGTRFAFPLPPHPSFCAQLTLLGSWYRKFKYRDCIDQSASIHPAAVTRCPGLCCMGQMGATTTTRNNDELAHWSGIALGTQENKER